MVDPLTEQSSVYLKTEAKPVSETPYDDGHNPNKDNYFREKYTVVEALQNWINLAQERGKWLAVMTTANNTEVS